MKILLISGSPRQGNTEYLIKKISEKIPGSEVLLLREKIIQHCTGCLYCHQHIDCVIKDEMDEIGQKVLEADFLIIGSPNYFDNVSGLLKDFVDRLHPFYKSESLKGKKLFLIMVGGGEVEGTKECLEKTMGGVIKHLKFDLIGSYCLKALETDDLKNDSTIENKINEIVELIK